MWYKKSLNIPKRLSECVNRRGQTTQWPKEKGQKNKQRSTKHTYKTKDRVTQIPLKTRDDIDHCLGTPVYSRNVLRGRWRT